MAAMWFIILSKFRRKPTRQDIEKMNAFWAERAQKGTKVHSSFWTLGRYDSVIVVESPDEKTAMQGLLSAPTDLAATETLVAVSREDAVKFLG